jgi:AcrR family transcriptional regulator
MTIEGIAAAAGVGKPTVYRRWPDKPSVAIAAIASLVAAEPPDLSGDTVGDIVHQLQSAHENLLRLGSVTLLGTLLAESEEHPQFIEAYRNSLLNPRRARLREILEIARSRGEITASDEDIDDATLVLVGLVYAKYMTGEPARINWLTPGVRLVVAALTAAR